MRKAFLLFLSLFVVATLSAQTHSDQSRNSCSDYLKLKKEVDNVINRIKNDYANDKMFMAKFAKAQTSWESYRDSQLEMIYPEADKSVYGTSYPTCRCNWLLDITNERLDYLVKWVSGTDKVDACSGSQGSDKRKSFVKFHE